MGNCLFVAGEGAINLYISQAREFMEKGDYDEAEKLYQKAIKIDEDSLDLLKLMADISYQKEEYQIAAEAYKNILKRDSEAMMVANKMDVETKAIYHSLIGDCFKKVQCDKKAKEHFNKAIMFDQHNNFALLNLAQYDKEEGNMDKAIEKIRRSLELNDFEGGNSEEGGIILEYLSEDSDTDDCVEVIPNIYSYDE